MRWVSASLGILALNCASPATAQLYWDINGSTSGLGGSGNWNTTDLFWNDSTGTGTAVVWPNLTTDSAIFDGTAGTVTISTTGIQANSLTFNTDGYVLAGTSLNTLTLAGTLPSINVSTGITIASAVIAGSAGLEKKGAGTLWVQTSTTVTGGITVSQGTLRLGTTINTSDPRTFINGNTLALNNGALEIYASSSANSVVATDGISISGISSITTFRTATSAAASISTNLTSTAVSMNGQLTWNVAGNTLSANTDLANLSLTLGAISLTGNSTFVPTGDGIRNTNIRLGAVGESGGVHSLTKTSGGNLRFDGTNTYTGTTFISEGQVYLSSTGSLSPNSAVVLNPATGRAAELDLGINNPHTEEIASLANTGDGTSTLVLGSSNLTVGRDNTSTTFSGVISGAGGSLIKTGSGTLSLTATNTFTGGLTISSGTLRIANSITALGGLPTAPTPVVFIRGGILLADTTAGALTSGTNRGFELGPVGSAGSVTIQVDGPNTFSIGGLITDASGGSGRLLKTGVGTLAITTSTNTFSGGVSILDGSLSIAIDSRLGAVPATATPGNLLISGGTFLANGTYTLNANRGIALGPDTGTGSGTIEVIGTETLTYGGIIADNATGSGRLIKTGLGTLRLITSANTFSGGVSILAGSLSLGIENRLGLDPATPTPGSILINGGALTLTGDLTLSSNRGIAIGPDTGSGSGTIEVTGTSLVTYGGVIANNGSGSGRLVKTGTGSLRLITSVNTFTGGVTVQGGLISFSLESRLGPTPGSTTPDYFILNGGGLRLTTNDVTLNSNRGMTLGPDAGMGTGVLNVDVGVALTYNGVIANNGTGIGALEKTETGTLVLGGANTYSGGTTVTAGTLLVRNSTGSATGTGAVSIIAGATLGGTGVISPTSTSGVTISGTLAPGVPGTNSGIGTLTFTPVDGNVTLDSTSSSIFELRSNGLNDRVSYISSGSGILDFTSATAGSLNVVYASGYVPALNDSFDLLDWTALTGSGIGGLNDNLLTLSTVGFDPNWFWDISQFTSAGVITISAVIIPEPSRIALLLLACMMCIGLSRRRGRDLQQT